MQILLNTDDLAVAYRAFRKNGSKTWFKTEEAFKEMFTKMVKERRFLKKFFLQTDLCKKLTMLESDLMIDVMKELMANNIPAIYHFDSFVVEQSNRQRALDIFNKVSVRHFKVALKTKISF